MARLHDWHPSAGDGASRSTRSSRTSRSPVTDGLAEVTEPVFDRSGKYLYFFGSTDAGPILDWFSQSGNDMQETRNVYLTVLRKDLPSPLAKESDEEGTAKETQRYEGPKDAKDAEGPAGIARRPPHGGGAPADTAHPTSRSASISTTSSSASSTCRFRPAICRSLQAGNAGQIYFIREIDEQADAAAIRSREAQAGDRARRCGGLPAVGGREEAALPLEGCLVHRADDEGGQGGRRQDRDRLDRAQDRSARRMDGDLQRSLAHQSRLFLRPGHARRRLDGGARRSTPRSCPTSPRGAISTA